MKKKDERITIKVTPQLHRKLIMKKHRIWKKTRKHVSFNDIINKAVGRGASYDGAK